VKSKRIPKRSQQRSKLQIQQLERRNLLAGDICHNFVQAGDVNLDGNVSPLDVVVVINRLSEVVVSPAESVLSDAGETEWLLDVDDNGNLSVNDALQVINHLSRGQVGSVVASEGVTQLAAAILTEDLPLGMRAHTAHAWFAKLHEKMDTPVVRREAFDHLDKNSDGELTHDELNDRHWDRILDADVDGTGAVTKAELRAARPSERMLSLLPTKMRPHFETLDANQDGQISEQEVTEKLWTRIVEADISNDDVVSLDELDEMRDQREFEHGRLGRDDIFERFDVNEDGLLTEDEVHERLWNKIAVDDVNEDGVVSVDELLDERDPQIVICDAPVLDRLFGQLDENADGFLTQSEVGSAIWAWVSQADSNHDDAVSMLELETTIEDWEPMHADVIFERYISRLNFNQDSVFTRDKMGQGLWERLVDADQNGDDAFTLDEMLNSLKDGRSRQLKQVANQFMATLGPIAEIVGE